MLRRPALRCLIGVFLCAGPLSCGGDEPPPPESAESAPRPAAGDPASARTDGDPAPAPPADTVPPGAVDDRTLEPLAFGRLRATWDPASDDRTGRDDLRYELTARSLAPASPALTFETEAGAHTLVVDVDPAYVLWSILAIDEAGNRGSSTAVRFARAEPSVRDLLTGGPAGAILDCTPDAAAGPRAVLCVGERGRVARFAPEAGWTEAYLAPGVDLTLARDPSGAPVLVGPIGRWARAEAGAFELVADAFPSPPAVPFRAGTFEPSGLFLWHDGDGAVWASSGGPFRRMHDPLLQGTEAACARLDELAFTALGGFARCENGGTQLRLRVDEAGYRWAALGEADALPPRLGPRHRYLFGEGRELVVFEREGDGPGVIRRYGMGGWRDLEHGGAEVSAIGNAGVGRHLWIAAGGAIERVNALGDVVERVEVPFATPVVYLGEPSAPADGTPVPPQGAQAPTEPASAAPPALAVSARGGVLELPSGVLLRAEPTTGFALVVRRAGAPAEVLGADLRTSLSLGDLVPTELLGTPPADILGHAATRDQDGALLLAGDAGAAGGALWRHDGAVWSAVALHSLVLPEVAAAPETADGVEGTAAVEPPPLPALAEAALAPLPAGTVVPPLRAVDVHPAGRAVAAGEGGTLWVRADAGWVAVPTAIATPLLAVVSLGGDGYLAAGTGGVVLTCSGLVCEQATLPVGDVRALALDSAGIVWAFGSEATAWRSPQGSWALEPVRFDPPALDGYSAPSALVDRAASRDQIWGLSDDGALWRRVDEGYELVQRFEGALAITLSDGGARVATRTSVYAIAAE